MDHSKKLDFVRHMTKLALDHVKHPEPVQHFDSGGRVQTQSQTTPLDGPNSEGTNQSHFDPTTTWGGGIGTTLGLQSTYAAGGADLQNGTNASQLNQSYKNSNEALENQGAYATSLIPQAEQGENAQSQLAGQFMAQANGEGPNVARNQLNEATGQNVANQAALMASQRGSSANTGLIARQAAQQGAATQQEAAGQAATLGAQQQIAAQQNAASLANTQVGQAGNALTNLSQGQQGEQNILQNANTAVNNANVGMQSNINSTNAQTAAANANGIGGLIGGGISAVGSIFAAFADGGEVKKITGNPLVQRQVAAPVPQSFVGNWLAGSSAPGGPNVSSGGGFNLPDTSGEQKNISDGISKMTGSSWDGSASGSAGYMPDGSYNDASSMGGASMAGGAAEGGASFGEMLAAKGGMVPAMVSPGERYLPPEEAKKVAKGEKAPLKAGKKIPGKPKYPGNDYRNDTVPTKLKEGGIVIPNKILQSKNPGHEAKKFVQAALAKKGLRK